MKLKIKISIKKIIGVTYVAILLCNIILFFFLAQFIRERVYNTYFVDSEFLQSQKLKMESDLNIDRFNEVVEKIETKQHPKNLKTVNNVFN